jgi:enterochelin esterase-like enzyme
VTADPARTVVGGASGGGLAAAFAALHHPERFGNVLAQSGSFSLAPARYGVGDDNEPGWLARQFEARPRLPLRFWLEADRFEEGGLAHTRRLQAVLDAKGYPVHFAEFVGAHSFACWRGTLADALLALLGDLRDGHRGR